MFDIGFGELLLVAVVALVVLGPERLPKAARTLGTLLRRVRNGWESVRDEVEREIEAEEMKQKLKEAQDYMRQATRDVDEQVRNVDEQVREGVDSVREAAKGRMPGTPADELDESLFDRDLFEEAAGTGGESASAPAAATDGESGDESGSESVTGPESRPASDAKSAPKDGKHAAEGGAHEH